MSARRLVRVLATTALLAPLAGCYALFGVVHGRTAAEKVEIGAERDHAIVAFAEGGVILRQHRFEWDGTRFVLEESDEEHEPWLTPEDVAERAFELDTDDPVHAVELWSRFWGTFGYGVAECYLDADDRVVAFDYTHVN